jgi:hypothetical protein
MRRWQLELDDYARVTVTPDALARRLGDFGLGGRARRSHFARENADERGNNGGETAGNSKGLEAHRTYLSVSVNE